MGGDPASAFFLWRQIAIHIPQEGTPSAQLPLGSGIGSTHSARVRLCSLVSTQKSSHQIRLALSRGGEGGKVRLGPGDCQLLRQEQWAIIHDAATQNNSLSSTLILLMQSLKVVMGQGEELARSYLGFFCILLSSTIAQLMVSSPTSRACKESCCAGRTGSRIARSAYPWCTVFEHLHSGNCPEARWAMWAHVGWAPRYRCADKVDGPYTGGPDSICDSEPEQWEWDLDEAGSYCPSVPEPPLLASAFCTVPAAVPFARAHSQPTCPFLPRWSSHGSHLTECDWLFLEGGERGREGLKASSSFKSLPTADSGATANRSRQDRAKHQKSVHSGIHFASCSADPLLARSGSAQEPAAAVLQSRRQPKPGKWTLRNRAAARGDSLCRPLLWAPSMAERDIILEALGELPDPGEKAPTRWPGQEAPEDQLSPMQPAVRRSETGQMAPPPQW